MNNDDRASTVHFLFIVFLISAAFCLIPNVPKSYGHAYIDHSDPSSLQTLNTAPSKIDIYFNDQIDVKYSHIRVLDSNGKEVQEDDLHYITDDKRGVSISLHPELQNGVYTVIAIVLDQTDGHVTKNPFLFGIGRVVPQNVTSSQELNNYQIVSIPETIARFPALVGQVMVAGAVSATLWLWSPISRISPLNDAILQTRIKIDSSMTRWITIGSTIILASDFVMIIVQAHSINAGILDAISTKFGNMLILRMIIASALLGLSYVMYYKMKKSPKILSKVYLLTMLVISCTVLATTSLISHGAATDQMIPLTLDFVHNVFASLWIGGIIYIAFVVMPHLKQITNSSTSMSVISLLIPRFSTLVVAILGAIVITGPFLLYVLENNLALTLASFYGKILIVKLSFAGAMISLGAYSQMVTYKSAYTTIIDNSEKNSTLSRMVSTNSNRILSKFNSNIKIEALIGIALIASVAILVDSGLPSSEFQNQPQILKQLNAFGVAQTEDSISHQTLSVTKFIENGSRIVLSVDPYLVGSNNIRISFLDQNKNPIDVDSVKLKFTQTDENIGPFVIYAQKVSRGVFDVKTDVLAVPGHWNVQVEGVPVATNSLSLLASYDDLIIQPKLEHLRISITEFKIPEKDSLPWYPVYDAKRNVVWVGDSKVNSSRLFEFELNSTRYVEHEVDGASIISSIALDSQDTLWYTDPLTKSIGHYNPFTNSDQLYKVPSQGILSGIAVDSSDNIWIIDSSANIVLKFDSKIKNFTSMRLADNSQPFGITIDKSSGLVWIAEGIGKIASVDPVNNNKIVEYAPSGNNTLATPTALMLDPTNGKIFIAEHDGHSVSMFDPLLKSFSRYELDPKGLPFGMVFDKYHYLWIAQHTLDKIAVINPRTGQYTQFDIPTSNSWVQWMTTDSQGRIIFAEQKNHALGLMNITANTDFLPATNQGNQTITNPTVLSQLGFDYVGLAGPSIAVGLIASAFFYSKSVIDFNRSMMQVRKNYLIHV